MIDISGYRPNIGIDPANSAGDVFFGGNVSVETLGNFLKVACMKKKVQKKMLLRELKEEVGLTKMKSEFWAGLEIGCVIVYRNV